MTWKRPAIIADNDTLRVLGADETDYRVPFTFVQALNEGRLFDRSARAFKTAAHDHRLFEVINTRTEAIVGTCIVQEIPDAHGAQLEVGGMMIHPGARHLGLNTLLTKTVMVRQFCMDREAPEEIEYIAHVVDGNAAPTHTFLASGFKAGAQVIVKPGQVDAEIRHMMDPGAEGVVMQSYVFDKRLLTPLIEELHSFLLHDGSTIRAQGLSIHVDLSAMIDLETLDDFLAERGGNSA